MIIFLLLIVQIIVESFPVSSSAHVQIAEQLIKFFWGIEVILPEALAHAVHLPTMIMLAIYFFRSWISLLLHPLRYKKCLWRMMLLGFFAESMTVVWYIGLPLILQALGISMIPYIYGLLLTAVVLCLMYARKNQQETHAITICDAFFIGTAQGIAVVPGISRLGLTYAVGLARGLSAKKAFIFSCMIEWPLILAGGLYGLREVVSYNMLAPFITWNVFFIISCATLIAYYALWLTQYLFERGYAYFFGIYLFIVVFISLLV